MMLSMGKAFLLTGKPGVGKSTALQKIIAQLGPEQCGGFYTQEVREHGLRRGFQIVTLSGQVGRLADVEFKSPLKIGKYGVDLASLEALAVPELYQALATKRYVLLDEIGPMELFSGKFKQAVLDVLASPKILVGTIMLRPQPFADQLKAAKTVSLYMMTWENRDQMPNQLVSAIKAERI